MKPFSHFISTVPAIKHPKTGKVTVAQRGQNHHSIPQDKGLEYEHGHYNTHTKAFHPFPAVDPASQSVAKQVKFPKPIIRKMTDQEASGLRSAISRYEKKK